MSQISTFYWIAGLAMEDWLDELFFFSGKRATGSMLFGEPCSKFSKLLGRN